MPPAGVDMLNSCTDMIGAVGGFHDDCPLPVLSRGLIWGGGEKGGVSGQNGHGAFRGSGAGRDGLDLGG